MKIEVIKPEQQSVETKYPCLKSYKEKLIVLFYSPEKGVAIRGNEKWGIGHYSDVWAEEFFTPLPGGTKIVITI